MILHKTITAAQIAKKPFGSGYDITLSKGDHFNGGNMSQLTVGQALVLDGIEYVIIDTDKSVPNEHKASIITGYKAFPDIDYPAGTTLEWVIETILPGDGILTTKDGVQFLLPIETFKNYFEAPMTLMGMNKLPLEDKS